MSVLVSLTVCFSAIAQLQVIFCTVNYFLLLVYFLPSLSKKAFLLIAIYKDFLIRLSKTWIFCPQKPTFPLACPPKISLSCRTNHPREDKVGLFTDIPPIAPTSDSIPSEAEKVPPVVVVQSIWNCIGQSIIRNCTFRIITCS